MNWDAISGTAELIGAIAVVVSLLYLAWEVRTNTRTLRADSAREAQIQWATVNERLYESPNLNIISRAFDPDSNADDFTDEEKRIVFFFARSIMQRAESELFQYQAGLLDPPIWKGHLLWVAGFVRLPVFKDWWETERNQPFYTQAFRNCFEDVSDAPLAPDLMRALGRPQMGTASNRRV